jgi:aminoglycoside phosphotransferase (APT) family kinase protein
MMVKRLSDVVMPIIMKFEKKYEEQHKVLESLSSVLRVFFGSDVEVQKFWRLGGGASKEAWALDVLIENKLHYWFVRRMGGGVIHDHALPLNVELAVIHAAHQSGVPVPCPIGTVFDLAGKEAYLMPRVMGEGIGSRIVRNLSDAIHQAKAELLINQMANALASIHKIRVGDIPELLQTSASTSAALRTIQQLERKLDEAHEPHPVIEFGLQELRKRISESGADKPHELVLVHGDFRVGNLLVGANGLAAVIDWEFAHWGHPLEDLAWPLVRAWRFGREDQHVGGIGNLENYLNAYNKASGSEFTSSQLAWWELAGNLRWSISCLTQARRHLSGAELNVELALLGRLASEVEYEILELMLHHQN